nr:MAG TPA: hypothetical protein [Caudoviricetes sp.]
MAVGGVTISLLLFLLPLSSSCVGVRGSARAALRARTLAPNTIAFSLVVCCVFFSLLLPAFPPPPVFPVIGMADGEGSPCVGVLCWHDCDG